MTIEEMVRFLCNDMGHLPIQMDAIIDALRAGQEIARTAEAVLTAVDTRPYAGGQQVQSLLPPHLQDPLQEAWEAYHAATKGEKE